MRTYRVEFSYKGEITGVYIIGSDSAYNAIESAKAYGVKYDKTKADVVCNPLALC